MNPSQDSYVTDLDALLRKRFRDLAGEYELFVHGGAGLCAGDDADDMRCELDDLADAINRIDDGLYGACRQCGQGIAMARLSAMPTVTLCGDCAEQVTRPGRVPVPAVVVMPILRSALFAGRRRPFEERGDGVPFALSRNAKHES